MTPLFDDETPDMRRVRKGGVPVLRHRLAPPSRRPRARLIFSQVLTAPFAGADHRARALIATSVFHRSFRRRGFPARHRQCRSAQRRRRGARAAHGSRLPAGLLACPASSAGALPHYSLRVTPGKIILDVPRRHEAIAGEPVQKRLGALAAAFGRKGEILIG